VTFSSRDIKKVDLWAFSLGLASHWFYCFYS